MENKVQCNIYNMDDVVYVIPMHEVDRFESTSYYDRKKDFSIYVLTDGTTLEDVSVDSYDFDNLVDGWV